MMFRNILVKPLGLRTSPLGCPVSSLLSNDTSKLFAGKYPVWNQRINDTDTMAQVILGANDKHLKFRTSVGVEIVNDKYVKIMLGNRVHCKNKFGKFYMFVVDYFHRNYITPAILRRSVDYVLSQATR